MKPSVTMCSRVESALRAELDPNTNTLWVDVMPFAKRIGINHITVRQALKALTEYGTIVPVVLVPDSLRGQYYIRTTKEIWAHRMQLEADRELQLEIAVAKENL